MTRWVVVFKDTPEMMTIRSDKRRRDAHVAFAKAHPELLIGGGLKQEPEEDFCGALWIVDAKSKDAVETLVRADPFFVQEYRSFDIFAWGKILEDQSVTL